MSAPEERAAGAFTVRRIELQRPTDETPEPGDLWRVKSVDGGALVLERVPADPDQFRSPRDGLWPRVPRRAEPISDAEAKAAAEEMEAAWAHHGRQFRDAAREHNEQLAQALQAELAAVEGPEPLTAEQAGTLLAEGIVDAVEGAWQASGLRGESPGPFSDLDCEAP